MEIKREDVENAMDIISKFIQEHLYELNMETPENWIFVRKTIDDYYYLKTGIRHY